MNLEEILKLPCDDELSELERIAYLRQIAAQERLADKRQRTKERYEESIAHVTNLYRGKEFDLACMRALKLDKHMEQAKERYNTDKFPCILHKGGPWAELRQVHNGDILYECPHDGGYRLTLPQVRASIAYKPVKGKAVNILHDHNAEHMAWRLLLLWEAGVIELLPIQHRPRPDYMREGTSRVYFGLLRLLALKWNVPEWYGHGTTFSLDFGAAWCGLSKDKVRGAMKWLLRSRYVKEVDQLKASFGKKLGMYLPG